MTLKELLPRICDASDGGVPKIAVFRPTLTRAHRGKKALTTLTFVVKIDEFAQSDLLEGGLWACLALGTNAQVKRLMDDPNMGIGVDPEKAVEP